MRLFIALAVACFSLSGLTTPAAAQDAAKKHITQGRAKTIIENLYKCPVKVGNHRVAGVGQITATDGTVITVPAETALQKGAKLHGADLYNECNQITPAKSSDVSTAVVPLVPVVEIDADGDIVTGYIVADNYFELYVNGKLVAADNTPFTPFNSVIVKFKVKRPYTYAFKLVDWEENLGLGTELNRDFPYHAGDGGVIARFSDGTVTDSSWKAQTFYIGPLVNPNEVIEKGNLHDTTKLGRIHPHARKPPCAEQCYAVHYPIPADWASPKFNDAAWPRAYEYTDEDIGVTGVPGYTRYPELFEGARWIWTLNLVFDNLVLARKTVR